MIRMSRLRAILGALNEVVLLLLVVSLFPLAILLLGVPLALCVRAVAALLRLL